MNILRLFGKNKKTKRQKTQILHDVEKSLLGKKSMKALSEEFPKYNENYLRSQIKDAKRIIRYRLRHFQVNLEEAISGAIDPQNGSNLENYILSLFQKEANKH